jgi:undecaprenyl-phosphate galactose phosphotransferase
MSLVGPRPYMVDEREEMGDALETILSVRPGITGLWQVSGRSHLDFPQRLEIDLWYIRNWSLWLDLVILMKTIKTLYHRDGAF